MLARILASPQGTRRLLINWVIAQVLLIGIWLLWLPEFFIQVSNHLTPERMKEGHSIFLIDPRHLGTILGNILGVSHTWKIQPALVALNAMIAVVAMYSAIRYRERNGIVFIVVLAPLLACLAAYFLVHPVFGYVIYTFCWLLVPYCILLAFGIWAIRPGMLRWAVLAIVVLGNLRGLQNYYAETPPPLDAIARYIGDHAQPGDAVIFSSLGSAHIGVAYYLQSAGRSLVGLRISRDGDALITTAAEAAENPRNWVILPDGEEPAVDLADLASRATLGFEQQFGSVKVLRFDRRQ